MTLHTSRGLPSFRDSPCKRKRATAKPCAWVIARVGRCTKPAILRYPESREPRCASHAMTLDEVN